MEETDSDYGRQCARAFIRLHGCVASERVSTAIDQLTDGQHDTL